MFRAYLVSTMLKSIVSGKYEVTSFTNCRSCGGPPAPGEGVDGLGACSVVADILFGVGGDSSDTKLVPGRGLAESVGAAWGSPGTPTAGARPAPSERIRNHE